MKFGLLSKNILSMRDIRSICLYGITSGYLRFWNGKISVHGKGLALRYFISFLTMGNYDHLLNHLLNIIFLINYSINIYNYSMFWIASQQLFCLNIIPPLAWLRQCPHDALNRQSLVLYNNLYKQLAWIYILESSHWGG